MHTLAANKRARFDFELLDTYEAGIELLGHEVKSIRAGKASLAGAHVVVRGGEAYLVNATIQPFQQANTDPAYDPERPRKLLISKKEIDLLAQKSERQGLTVVPVSMYNKKQHIKLQIAVARGKKKHDKRESIKARDTKRDIERTLKR